MKKNFIAGAVCPRCSKMDTIALCRTRSQPDPMLSTQQQDQLPPDTTYRQCISCGFEDTMLETPGGFTELNTRVNRPLRKDPSVKPLIFHKPKKN